MNVAPEANAKENIHHYTACKKKEVPQGWNSAMRGGLASLLRSLSPVHKIRTGCTVSMLALNISGHTVHVFSHTYITYINIHMHLRTI